MKKLQILGTGCSACRTLAERVERAVEESGRPCTVEKVTDMADILAFDVVATPALVVDGEVRVAGRVPTLDEIRALIH